ncbi:hypothetical protein RRF57_001054 [Xylaria bambusicola]|uniref:Uncharacterized protein n=1 Tax=Xylaria bambusicola TaxID=326684 RepID=A0AAN7UBV4_9PEZI
MEVAAADAGMLLTVLNMADGAFLVDMDIESSFVTIMPGVITRHFSGRSFLQKFCAPEAYIS